MGKKEIEGIEKIKKLLKSEKVVIGTDRTLKLLKNSSVESVFLSSNCPETVRRDIEYYAKMTKTPVIALNQPSDELGILCKKPYHVSVLCTSQ